MPEIITDPSPNCDDRGPGFTVDMLVLHYTGMETAAAALERLKDPKAEVSAHYLIDEDGNVHRLVDERMRAWHAGVAHWRGRTDINARSIGIELVNPGHEWGYREFPEPQIRELEAICLGVLTRHPIPARNVVGHSDVAPTRKTDPGELFPWERLAGTGIGLWPAASDNLIMEQPVLADALTEIGYDVTDFSAALKAFQRHFRPDRVTGRIDAETARRVFGLVEMIRRDDGAVS
ncbi:MAG: N-acetylmuramoyl-L-alanine amidase [Rhodospirillaceae bacterium]|nr:N-acetylmuramoyl-L-alanine amidase [Magnetovibrio sp.]MAY68880.1 N-acetylmuramoyl-L-alanine amidase [Rhodospirillaceae bacterium]